MKTKSTLSSCCGVEMSDFAEHPDHGREVHRLNRISGQIDGVKRMIDQRKYCPEIIMQIQAVRSALKSLEAVLLERHLENCVRDVMSSRDSKQADEKLAEILKVFRGQ